MSGLQFGGLLLALASVVFVVTTWAYAPRLHISHAAGFGVLWAVGVLLGGAAGLTLGLLLR
jgi:hypothetical protein